MQSSSGSMGFPPIVNCVGQVRHLSIVTLLCRRLSFVDRFVMDPKGCQPMLECCLHIDKDSMVWSPVLVDGMGLHAVPDYIIHYHWSLDQCNRAWRTLAISRHIISRNGYLFSPSLPNQVFVLRGMDPVIIMAYLSFAGELRIWLAFVFLYNKNTFIAIAHTNNSLYCFKNQ